MWLPKIPTERWRFRIVVALQGLWLLAAPFSAGAQMPGSGAAASGKAAPRAEAAAAKPEPPPPQAIPLAEIAVRAAQLKLSLRTIADTLPDARLFAGTEAEVEHWDTALKTEREEVDAMLRSDPGSIELRELKNYWENVEIETGNRRKLASVWAEAAQKAISHLDSLREEWAVTLKANEGDPALRAVAGLVRESLDAIDEQRTATRDSLLRVVRLQVTTVHNHQAASEIVQRLSSEQVTKGLLFRRDSAPLWDTEARRASGDIQTAAGWNRVRWRRAGDFASSYNAALCWLGLLLVLSLWGARRLRGRVANVVPAKPTQAVALRILQRWVALGVSVPLLFFCLLLPRAPTALIGLIILIWCFPILRLLPIQEPRSEKVVNRAVGVYAAYALVAVAAPSPAFNRDLTFALNCLTLLIFGQLVRPSRIRTEWANHPRLVCEALTVLGAIGISTAASFFGYMRLAQFVKVTFVYGAFIALGIYCTMRTLTLLLVEATRTPRAARLALIRLHHAATEVWLPRLLYGTGILLGLAAVLDLMGVRGELMAAIGRLFAVPLGPASSLTIGTAISVLLTLAVGYLIATAARFLLREEILRRFTLPRGIPELIASGTFYVLLVIFVMSAASAGSVEWTRLTLFTGALGVGVGFGLQNIISNFMSGLILQFERPINPGDVVEIEGQTGVITRIGIRSSTIRTFQGAEVVMPNANFISSKVTNWTLTETNRRVEIPVGVAYGTRPDRVEELLLQAAKENPGVLTEPAPAVYFMSFGDSSLNFELWFWVLKTSSLVQIKSDVSLTLMKLLEEAGIAIPFPQRDLHVHHADSATPRLDAPAADEESASTSA